MASQTLQEKNLTDGVTGRLIWNIRIASPAPLPLPISRPPQALPPDWKRLERLALLGSGRGRKDNRRRTRHQLGRIEAALGQQTFYQCLTHGCAGAGQEVAWERKDDRADLRTHGLDLRAFLGGVGWLFFGPVKE